MRDCVHQRTAGRPHPVTRGEAGIAATRQAAPGTNTDGDSADDATGAALDDVAVEDVSVTVIIPTLNEAPTIDAVVDGFLEQGVTTVLVIDGGSTDGTQSRAAAAGADVRMQSGSGKGQALREAMQYVTTDYIVTVDGDGTYDPADLPSLLTPVVRGRAAHVIGNRFADMEAGAMTRLNKVGNTLINQLFTRVHGRNFKDILSGYRAFTADAATLFAFGADGFGVETELAVESVRHHLPTTVVPITYRPRPQASETNLRPVRDGAQIFYLLYHLARMTNPMFYFGALGAGIGTTGAGVTAFVAYDWIVNRVSHEGLLLIGVFLLLTAVQLVIFGVLADQIKQHHQAQLQRFDYLTSSLLSAAGGTAHTVGETPSRETTGSDDWDDGVTESEAETE